MHADPLSKEQNINRYFYPLFLGVFFTGFTYSGFNENLHDFHQWALIIHYLLAVPFTLFFLAYLLIHFQRTIRFRRPSAMISGLTLMLIIIASCISGWSNFIFGLTESLKSLDDLHLMSSFAGLLFLLLHIFIHIKTLPEKRKKTQEPALPSTQKSTYMASFYFVGTIVCIIFLLTLSTSLKNLPKEPAPLAKNYSYPYGEHPFRPSQTETTNNQFISPNLIGNSDECITCHADIGKQWQSSIHKKAASDPTYVTNISLLSKKKGIASTRYCEGCHAPAALLTGLLSEGGAHGGIKDSLGFKEGVSCRSCHNIKEIVHVKGVASYQYSPERFYLFHQSTNSFLQWINRLMIKTSPTQHKADFNQPVLSQPEMCASCHAQFMDKDMNDWGWVKMQDEYSAWLESPFSGRGNDGMPNQTSTDCIDCHMPLVNATDPSANSSGQVKNHSYFGANTAIPFLDSDYEHLSGTISFLQNKKMRITINEPRTASATQDLSALDESIRTYQQTPSYVYAGQQAHIEIIVSNIGVGHNFPGGTIDINQAWIELTLVDATGSTLFKSGSIQNDIVDPNSHFYRSIPVDRHGKQVWKHDLFNKIGESYRNVIKAQSSDIVNYFVDIPSSAAGPIVATARLRYRKFNHRYASWALKEKYTPLPIVDLAIDNLQIPVKLKSETIINSQTIR